MDSQETPTRQTLHCSSRREGWVNSAEGEDDKKGSEQCSIRHRLLSPGTSPARSQKGRLLCRFPLKAAAVSHCLVSAWTELGS